MSTVKYPSVILPVFSTLLFLLLVSCSNKPKPDRSKANSMGFTIDGIQDTTSRVASATGLSGPESVRYDPEQDIYFVSNFNGSGDARDSNGFISKVSPEGKILELKFMTGTETHPLHAPRGMYITGDTLWAADADGVHGFDRHSGAQVAFIDFTSFDPGFLNDVAAGPDGALYVTDTGRARLYKATVEGVTVVQDSLPHPPNGITIDEEGQRMLLCPWEGAQTFYAWVPADSTLEKVKTYEAGALFDGIEIVNNAWVVSSQADSTIRIGGTAAVKTAGKPADIGIDTKRMRVAVPYIALNRVDIWDLPSNN